MKALLILACLLPFSLLADDFIKDHFTIYAQEDFRGEAKLKGTLNNIGYNAKFDMNSPITTVGVGYLTQVMQINNDISMHLGGRILKSFTQDAETVQESTANTTTNSTSSAELDVTSLLGNLELRYPVDSFSIIGGALLGVDFTSVDNIRNFTIDTDPAFVYGLYAGVKKDHLRGEAQFKHASGSMTGKGLGIFSGLNLDGDYSYSSFSLAFGYDF
jgi:hypothetical protein